MWYLAVGWGRGLAYSRSNSFKIKYCLSNCHPEEHFVLSNCSASSQAVPVRLGPLEAEGTVPPFSTSAIVG